MTTNKQIIIDGIDVSKCIKYHYKGCTAYDFTQCGNNPNCYYKQLKRKEQKLEKIKKVVTTHKEQRCIICEYYDDCFDCDDVLL